MKFIRIINSMGSNEGANEQINVTKNRRKWGRKKIKDGRWKMEEGRNGGRKKGRKGRRKKGSRWKHVKELMD